MNKQTENQDSNAAQILRCILVAGTCMGEGWDLSVMGEGLVIPWTSEF